MLKVTRGPVIRLFYLQTYFFFFLNYLNIEIFLICKYFKFFNFVNL